MKIICDDNNMNSTANLENRLRAVMASPGLTRVKARRALAILDILETRKNANTRLINGVMNVLTSRRVPLTRKSHFEKFTNHILNVTKNNTNLNINLNKKSVTLSYGNRNNNRNYSYVRFMPSMDRRGVYLELGRTGNNRRGKGEGTRLRKYGVNAAIAAGVPLYQYGLNMENLLENNNAMPISTGIMRKLGAVSIKKIPGYDVKTKWASMVRAHPYKTRTAPSVRR
jgi:hypothetical protein